MLNRFVIEALPEPSHKHFPLVQRNVHALMEHKDYDISLKYHQVEADFSTEYNKLCDYFSAKKQALDLKYPTVEDYLKLVKLYKYSCIYRDKNGTMLRESSNSKVSIYLSGFASECYPKFKLALDDHFQDKPNWKVNTSFKDNSVRIW